MSVTELSQVKDAPQSPLPWGSKKYQERKTKKKYKKIYLFIFIY